MDTLEEYTYALEIEDNEGTALLKAMDITPQLQEQFITNLGNKYGAQFHSELRFKQRVIEQFKLEEDRQKPATYAHVFKFSGLTGIHEHVTKLIEMDTPFNKIKQAALLGIDNYLNLSKSESTSRAPHGFFTHHTDGQTGFDHAAELRKALESQTTTEDLIRVINDFLDAPQTSYHRHSLASCIRDELTRIPDFPEGDAARFANYKPYQG